MRRLRQQEGKQENIETLFMFSKGDKVLRRRKVVSKIAPKAEGPFEVIGVSGTYQQRITIKALETEVGAKRQRPTKPLIVHAS